MGILFEYILNLNLKIKFLKLLFMLFKRMHGLFQKLPRRVRNYVRIWIVLCILFITLLFKVFERFASVVSCAEEYFLDKSIRGVMWVVWSGE